MSLMNKNQLVTAVQLDGSRIQLYVQLTPVKPSAVYEYVERIIRHPHMLLCELEDVQYFRVGTEVDYGAKVYNVLYIPIIDDVGGPLGIADHAQVFLEDAGVLSA